MTYKGVSTRHTWSRGGSYALALKRRARSGKIKARTRERATELEGRGADTMAEIIGTKKLLKINT